MDWQQVAFFCGIVGLWSGLIVGVLHWMLNRSDQHVSKRLDDVAKRVEDFRSDTQALDLKLAAFKTEVAEKYVQREDWIRFAVTIEAKLDRLGGKIDAAAR